MPLTIDSPEIAAAREALLSAQTQGNRFAVVKAQEDLFDAKLAAIAGGGKMAERAGEHPMDIKRREHREMREAQLARTASQSEGK